MTWGVTNIIRILIVDNFVFKHTIGNIIAAIANYSNPHYRTEPSTLSTLLANLIFPGGAKKPIIKEDFSILLDPVLSYQFDALKRAEQHRDHETNNFHYDETSFEEFYLDVAGLVKIASVRAQNKTAEALDQEIPNNRIYLLAFNGNSGAYQDEMPVDAQMLKECDRENLPVELIRFNYPGVLNSSGFASNREDVVIAGVAEVQYLLDKAVNPKNIQLHGTSLGGSIASHVMSHFYQRGILLGGLCVSRTFSSTTNVALSYIRRIPYVGGFLSFILRPIIAFGLAVTQYQYDTAKHFASLPEEVKWYTNARTPKLIQEMYQVQGLNVLDDDVLR